MKVWNHLSHGFSFTNVGERKIKIQPKSPSIVLINWDLVIPILSLVDHMCSWCSCVFAKCGTKPVYSRVFVIATKACVFCNDNNSTFSNSNPKIWRVACTSFCHFDWHFRPSHFYLQLQPTTHFPFIELKTWFVGLLQYLPTSSKILYM